MNDHGPCRIIRIVVGELEEDLLHAFLLLSIFPASFSTFAAAEVLGLAGGCTAHCLTTGIAHPLCWCLYCVSKHVRLQRCFTRALNRRVHGPGSKPCKGKCMLVVHVQAAPSSPLSRVLHHSMPVLMYTLYCSFPGLQ